MDNSRRSSTESTLSNASTLPTDDDVNLELETRVKEVMNRCTQPFAALNELRHLGAITDITVTDDGQQDDKWAVNVAICIGPKGTAHTCRGLGSRKADAKAAAALQCLNKIHTAYTPLSKHADTLAERPKAMVSSLPDPSQMGPTKKQLQAMHTDQMHLLQVHRVHHEMRNRHMATVCISLDIEVYELDHSVPLEVGLSFMRVDPDGNVLTTSHHLIASNYSHVRNGVYCEDNKDNFLPEFGTSEPVGIESLAGRVEELIQGQVDESVRIYWIGHSIDGDIKWLKEMGVCLPTCLMERCDIGRAYRALRHPEQYGNLTGMRQMLTQLDVPFRCLHNGGNDAAYNLKALSAIYEGSQASCSIELQLN